MYTDIILICLKFIDYWLIVIIIDFNNKLKKNKERKKKILTNQKR